MSPTILASLWQATWQASLIALVVILLQLVLRNRISASWRHALWLLVLARLALPVLPPSPISAFNLPLWLESARSSPVVDVKLSIIPVELPTIVEVPQAEPMLAHAVERSTMRLEPTSSPQVLSLVMLSIWVAGAVVILSRAIISTDAMFRLRKRMRPVTDSRLLSLLDSARRDMHIRRRVRLLRGDDLPGPALCGVLRPALLLPRRLIDRLNHQELRLVMLHELAHLKRQDLLINWIGSVVTSIHWFNPVAWLSVRRIRAEAELACDEMVLCRSDPQGRRIYGDVLVRLAEIISVSRHTPAAVGILESSKQIRRRVTMIANFSPRRRGWNIVAAAIAVLLMTTLLTDCVRSQATQPKVPEQPDVSPAPTPETRARRVVPLAVGNTESSELLRVLHEKRSEVEAKFAALQREIGEFQRANPDLSLQPIRSSELAAISQAYIQAQLNRIDASTRFAKGHPQERAAHRKEEELYALYQQALQRHTPLHAKAEEYARMNGELANLQTFQQRLNERIRDLEVALSPSIVRTAAVQTERFVLDLETEQRNGRLAEALHKSMPEIKLEQTALSDALDFLDSISNINMVVDWAALEQVGISADTPVSVRLADVPLGRALEEILNSAGGEQLRHFIDRGVVRITTRDRASRIMFTRTYDVRDLAADSHAGELVQLIARSVSPEVWTREGGGDISFFADKLVITASDDTHREINKLLSKLRETSQE